MGQGYGCTCNKCGYSFHANLGVGFLFPMVYQETVEAMKLGKYGDQGKKFFEDHPDGAIDCETVVARCSACGEYGQVPALTMYVPKKDYDPSKIEPKGRWSVAFPFEGADYVDWMDLEKYYDLYEKYDHRCLFVAQIASTLLHEEIPTFCRMVVWRILSLECASDRHFTGVWGCSPQA